MKDLIHYTRTWLLPERIDRGTCTALLQNTPGTNSFASGSATVELDRGAKAKRKAKGRWTGDCSARIAVQVPSNRGLRHPRFPSERLLCGHSRRDSLILQAANARSFFKGAHSLRLLTPGRPRIGPAPKASTERARSASTGVSSLLTVARRIRVRSSLAPKCARQEGRKEA